MVPAVKIEYSFTFLVYMQILFVYLSAKPCIKYLIFRSNSERFEVILFIKF
jgi:hypothetical protein